MNSTAENIIRIQPKIKDDIRTLELNKQKVKVVRICNLDVTRNFYGVCEYIDRAVKEGINKMPSSDEEGGTP